MWRKTLDLGKIAARYGTDGGFVMDADFISRAQAQAEGRITYITGEPCKRGHVSERYTVNGCCRACTIEDKEARRKANPAEDRDYCARYREKAAGVLRSRERMRRLGIPAPPRSETLTPNPMRLAVQRAQQRNLRRLWDVENREFERARKAEYHVAELRATPGWADPKQIAAVYFEARRLELETGIPYHVDHAIPLRGRNVCGLHVHDNLRAIPALDNISKGNRLTDAELLELEKAMMTGPYRMTGPLPDAVPEPGFDPDGPPLDEGEPGPEVDPGEEPEEGEPEEEAG